LFRILQAHYWNAAIRNFARLRVKGGIGILTRETASGQVVSADPAIPGLAASLACFASVGREFGKLGGDGAGWVCEWGCADGGGGVAG
jgi:hypothetical protein